VPRRVIVACVALLVGLAGMPAAAAERTVVMQADFTVPILGARALGTMTVVYDDATGAGTWQFQGTLDGKPAAARGAGTFDVVQSSGDDVTFTFVMTSADEWQVPGVDHHVPRTAALRSAGNMAYLQYDGPVIDLFAIPVRVEPPLSVPVEGMYVLTNAQAGEQPIVTIPGTGVGPRGTPLLTAGLVLLVASVATALLCLAAGLLRHPAHPATPRGRRRSS
jgi:hypothetical protein